MRVLIFILLVGNLCMNCTSPNQASDRFVYEEVRSNIIQELEDAGFNSTQKLELYLRAYKWEEKLEVFLRQGNSTKFSFFKSYDFCTNSGSLGPKRKEGDRQIPEGFYYIDRFNPKSKFHLSLGLNYPNESDRIKGDPSEPGSDIFIHGGCMSIGCIAITDAKIEELFVLAEQIRLGGQAKIPVHIFPFAFDSPEKEKLKEEFPQHKAFWDRLFVFDNFFKNKANLSDYKINDQGDYYLVQ